MRASVLAVAVTLVLLACGNPAGVVPGGAGEPGKPTTRPTVTDTPRPAVLSEDCIDEVGAFFDALFDLNSRLDVGLNFSAYSERVGDAKVAYDRIDIDALDAACITVAAKAEDAYNAYADAYNTWNACIGDTNCDNDSITPDLQDDWAKASTLLDEVEDALP